MVLRHGAVMSKSKGNVVDPDEMLATYGADALRLYEMFVAPPEKEIEWTDAGLEGSARFLGRVWRLVVSVADALVEAEGVDAHTTELPDRARALRRKTHQTIRRVSHDIDPRVHLNTAISALMELVNELYAYREAEAETTPTNLAVQREAVEALVLMLSPFTPHLSEELWETLGHADGVVAAGWPTFDPDVARAAELVVPVQVNGRVRSRLTVDAELSEADLERHALAEPKVAAHLSGKTVVRVVVVAGKLVNIVAR